MGKHFKVKSFTSKNHKKSPFAGAFKLNLYI